MLNVTHGLWSNDGLRTTEIDFHPPAGPVIRLTPKQWRELVNWIRTNTDGT